ncbi:MAG TPA: hypothetical protein PLO89_11165 [Spirochaetota bacterium]|nr:hypothetical protein [Spirochaetota bacterium]
MKKVIYLLFVFLYLSCFTTTLGYVKQNIPKIETKNDIYLFVNVEENSFIDKDILSSKIKTYLSERDRIPPFIVRDIKGEGITNLEIRVKKMNFDSRIIDRTEEKQKEEREIYKKRVEEYEKEKKIADEMQKTPPPEIEPQNEETVSYKIRQFLLNADLETFLENDSNNYNEKINSTVFKEVVIEHKIRKIRQNTVFSFTPTGNIFSDITANIVTGFLNFIFSGQAEADKKDNKSENDILKELRINLFSDICQKIYLSVSPYFIRFAKEAVYLIPINSEVDKKTKEILGNKNIFLSIFKYLESIIPEYKNDLKARIYFNLSILYFYHKEDEKANYYYNLGVKEKYNVKTVQIFNSILPFLGKNYLIETNR